jgi:hypothetical protein
VHAKSLAASVQRSSLHAPAAQRTPATLHRAASRAAHCSQLRNAARAALEARR